MERMTAKCLKGSGYYMACSKMCPYDCMEDCDCEEFDNFVDRLGAIEDILGDEYDLDRLRELVEADKTLKEFAEDVARQFGYHGTTADGRPRVCEEVARTGKILAVHAESDPLIDLVNSDPHYQKYVAAPYYARPRHFASVLSLRRLLPISGPPPSGSDGGRGRSAG